ATFAARRGTRSFGHADEGTGIAPLDLVDVADDVSEPTTGAGEPISLKGVRGHAVILFVDVGQVEILTVKHGQMLFILQLRIGLPYDSVFVLPGSEEQSAIPITRAIEFLRGEDFCPNGEEIFIPAGLIRERAAHCPSLIDGVSGIHFVGVTIVVEGAQLEGEISVAEEGLLGSLLPPQGVAQHTAQIRQQPGQGQGFLKGLAERVHQLLNCVWHGAFITDALLSPTRARGNPQRHTQKNDERKGRETKVRDGVTRQGAERETERRDRERRRWSPPLFSASVFCRAATDPFSRVPSEAAYPYFSGIGTPFCPPRRKAFLPAAALRLLISLACPSAWAASPPRKAGAWR